ncbi:unnamed protein product [Urochloa decumbens]|uniref:PGG domain-containing protein n=1 Tax=Urochloa decumbens TaxID=240449 RepID=A0ABC8VZ02_9POAL
MAEQPGGAAGEEQRTASTEEPKSNNKDKDPWEYKLRKYLLLLATLVATVTYGAAFNPPGGVWQDGDPTRERIAGDPIIRETSYPRYLAFFYSNATAFASSLVVIVLVLILSILHERESASLTPLRILRIVMVLDLFSLMAAYAAGTFRDGLTSIYSSVLLTGVVAYLAVHASLAYLLDDDGAAAQGTFKRAVATKLRELLKWLSSFKCRADKGKKDATPEKKMTETAVAKLRKVLMLLATFAVSVTYVAGLSAPGGFWDNDDNGHHPGRAILKGGRHDARLKAFFVFNTTAFVASLLIIIILLDKKLSFSKNFKLFELYGFIAATVVGLVGAYSAGSCREIDTTIYINSLIGAVIGFIILQAAVVKFCKETSCCCSWSIPDKVSRWLRATKNFFWGPSAEEQQNEELERARSLVLLLATLAAAITYQAGLNPPGGLWQADGDIGGRHRYMAGDPILLSTNPRRYQAFYYCNSIAFVASLVAIMLSRMKTLHHHNALEAAMILDLLGLIGAYAAGSCRDVGTSIYAMALAGAVLVYVVIHLVLLDRKAGEGAAGRVEAPPSPSTGEKKPEETTVEKRRKRLLLFAILAATITYQAGLTPPGGFLLKDDNATGHLAGDPVLLNNYPRRYTAFFYCNSVSFMLSIALIILLVNPNLYRPAIRTNALSVCTAVGMMGIMGAYAAGCTQHFKTSMYIFALAGFVLLVVIVAVVFLARHEKKPGAHGEGNADLEMQKAESRAEEPSTTKDPVTEDKVEKKMRAKRKYLMLLGILAASITYQAGLAPPGAFWQDDGDRHAAGDPVMHDNRRVRYLTFFYSNSTSFVASIVVIVFLLPPTMDEKWFSWWLGVMNTTIVLDLLGLLIAYAAGSSRSWKTSVKVSALVIAVLAYFVLHVVVSCIIRRRQGNRSGQRNRGTNGHVELPQTSIS